MLEHFIDLCQREELPQRAPVLRWVLDTSREVLLEATPDRRHALQSYFAAVLSDQFWTEVAHERTPPNWEPLVNDWWEITTTLMSIVNRDAAQGLFPALQAVSQAMGDVAGLPGELLTGQSAVMLAEQALAHSIGEKASSRVSTELRQLMGFTPDEWPLALRIADQVSSFDQWRLATRRMFR